MNGKQWMFAAVALTMSAMAHAQLTVSVQAGPVVTPAFPVDVDVTMELSLINNGGNCITNSVNSLVVTAALVPDGAPSIIYNQNPATGQECPAIIPFTWTVAAAGTYVLEATAKQGNTTAEDMIEVSVEIDSVLVDVEFPAPPAIANAYINATPELKALKGQRRGCIINAIAQNHGKLQRYGARPGPYDEGLIESDVDSMMGC